MKAVVFDLDNTLYPEIEFVKSGFTAVARYLSSRYHYDTDSLLRQMLDIMNRDGRGKIFDSLLSSLGIYTPEKVRLLVYLYRSHSPNIRLYDDVRPTLKHLRDSGMSLGLLTDGMASVQRRKIAALGLESLFDAIVCTDELGQDSGKPSPIPYQIILDLLGVSPAESAYVGNDPEKDFPGPNLLGMLGIHLQRPGSMAQTIPQNARARFVIKEMKDILSIVGVGV